MGGGGGGGSFFRSTTPEELRQAVLKASQDQAGSQFEADLAQELGQRLTRYGERDADLTRDRLTAIKAIVAEDIDGSVDSLFGGSVTKRTYIDGLSDIDALLLVHKTELAESTPARVLAYLGDKLGTALVGTASVRTDKMAVTLDYDDGSTIELLPALKTSTGFKIASEDGRSWTHIAPQKFAAALTRHNERCGGKLIPVIKLAKAINATLPPTQRLTGYHMESLGIEAFRGYGGVFAPAPMLRHYFDRARHLVLEPIKDTTGQTLHVDDYLGAKGSDDRKRVAHLMDRISRRIANATASKSLDQWRDLLGEV